MAKEHELRPNKTAFFVFRYWLGFIYILFVFLIAYAIANIFIKISVVWFLLAFVILQSIRYIALFVRYKKERYIFLKERILHKGGGIFSDFSKELVIKNITHVDLVLPFIEHYLFKTGLVMIESAGSGGSEIFLSSVDQPKDYYEYVQKLMKMNGFRLNMKKLVREDKPNIIGVFFETFRNFISIIGGIILFLFYVVGENMSALIKLAKSHIVLATILIALGIFILLIKSVLNFLDLQRRKYRVYDDAITFYEGYLTKHDSVIPLENLADTTTTQTIVDRIFGLFDVIISCQGTGQEIHFKNMDHGKELEDVIDKLIGKSKTLVGKKRSIGDVSKEEKKKMPSTLKASKATKLSLEKSYTANFKMDMAKSLFWFYAPAILIVIIVIFMIILSALLKIPVLAMSLTAIPGLIVIGIIPLVTTIIKVICTTFIIKPGSMEQDYKFISARKAEFTNDKIMAVVFKKSIIDYLFNTHSIAFWSIGSSTDIVFQNIKEVEGLRQKVLAKIGIKHQPIVYEMKSDYSFIEMLKATLFSSIVLIGATIVLIGAGIIVNPLTFIPVGLFLFGVGVGYTYNLYYYERSRMFFHKDFVHFRRGIIIKEDFYAIYDNIKDITTVKYPLSKLGSIQFDVAGEHLVQTGKNNQQTLMSNSFQINYIPKIETKDELIDLVLHTRPNLSKIKEIEENIRKYSPDPVMTRKPDLGNSLVSVIIFLILFDIALSVVFRQSYQKELLPLVILGVVAINLIVLVSMVVYVRMKTYLIQPYRVVFKWGVFYKKQKSIVFNKVDHIGLNQGFINKVFRNSTITVNTTGSSFSELVLTAMPKHKEFYDTLEKYY